MRSSKSASCLRRKRFSAAKAARDRRHSARKSPRSTSTVRPVVAACEKAVIRPLAINMKAWDLILRRYRKSLKSQPNGLFAHFRAWKPECLALRWYVCAAERESARRTKWKHQANRFIAAERPHVYLCGCPRELPSWIFSSPHAAAQSRDSGECEALANPALVVPGTIGALLSRYVWPIA